MTFAWDEAKEFMVGKKNIKHKSFKSYEEAKAFLEDKEMTLDYNIPTVYIDGSLFFSYYLLTAPEQSINSFGLSRVATLDFKSGSDDRR